MRKLNVLIACEESQAVCKEFRRLGHNAFSCDIQECSGGHPEWHIHGDCFEAFEMPERRVFFGSEAIPVFYTQDGERHILPRHKWDLVIAHPPCTYLAVSSKKYLNTDKYGEYAEERKRNQEEAAKFFLRFTEIDCDHVAIENPRGCMSIMYRKCDQVINPWNFGDNVSKETHLWLKGLPRLQKQITERPEPDVVTIINKKTNETRSYERFFYETRFLPAEERRKVRSKTFTGIARAMTEQWSEYLTEL